MLRGSEENHLYLVMFSLGVFQSMEKQGLSLSKFPETNGRVFFEISGKVATLRGIPNISEISYRKFPLHLTFLPKFPEVSVECFAYRKCNNFRTFRKLSQEISVAFVPGSKLSEFLIEWKATKGTRAHD